MSGGGLVLIGSPVSNYVNIVRAALLEKGLPHRHEATSALQEAAFLARSPMGKVPMLETEAGPLAETVAILDYLDDRYPETQLRPADAFARARMRQAINVLQVYVEVPARALYAHVFAGASLNSATADEVRATLDRATVALRRLVRVDHFLGGESYSQLDAFAFNTFELVERVSHYVWDRSLVNELGLGPWRTRIAARTSSKVILGDFAPALHTYLIDHGASAKALELFANA